MKLVRDIYNKQCRSTFPKRERETGLSILAKYFSILANLRLFISSQTSA